MDIHAKGVGVTGSHGPLLQPTSLRVRSGQLAVVAGEPGTGHTPLALVLAGRLRPNTGTVWLDGRVDAAALRRGVALVDAPEVNAPEEGLSLADVVAEELTVAGARAGRRAVRQWLDEHDVDQPGSIRFADVPARTRTRLLVELAAARPGVGALLIDSPDRHGDDPHQWWSLAESWAERGFAVVVLCTTSSARLLGVTAARLGETDQPDPLSLTLPTTAELEESR
ncbi:ATP-binding cassette domain-containing protein [Goodfellowiella coeruleoviolacea]|uniref:AAA+ ATPase domain-containing protein n=1 Tax=Goodfellowiella coeruleoviolacea TaxID=334858 RepID=A0AAE3GBX7_9PSEU|nr:ATP-binding cassette domain-containing protein [Goodfellowiella coeruleoviolacea]MCP2164574.1 hypothetical protein [Goodfellowiella coeruleoviolacea]